jgi:hypothetical protein
MPRRAASTTWRAATTSAPENARPNRRPADAAERSKSRPRHAYFAPHRLRMPSHNHDVNPQNANPTESAESQAKLAVEVAPRNGVAFVVYATGALITACMALWFALYVFQALNGDLTMTDQVRGPNAPDVARGSEPGSFWFLVVLWSAAFAGSAQASVRCARFALRLRKSLGLRRLSPRA